MNDPTMYDEDTRLVVALGDYPRDPNGQTTGFFNAGNGTWGEEQSWDGGRLIGNYYSGYTYFLHSSVGSSSPTQITDGSGGLRGNETYYPYGQEWNYVNRVSNYWQYYGGYSRYEWDIGLYLTPTRSYSPLYGRWLTPDKLGGDVTNPQSLNRYAYVLNNPATLTDPLGLDPYGGNPGDPCSDPAYADSHANCGWNPCWDLPPEGWSQSNCSGTPGVIGGGGIGSMLPPVPPAGQPPLGGMGNASFPNGAKVCSIIFVPGVGPRMSCNWTLFPSLGVIAGIGGAISGALAYLYSHPVFISVNEGGAGQITYKASTKTLCVNGGLGASFPPTKMATVGVLNGGNMENWTNVLSSFGYSFGSNLILGYQGSFNSAGKIGGPTISGIGASGSYTYGGCMTFPWWN